MLADQLARLLQPPDPTQDPDDVRELADEILSRPEYREPPKSLFERIQEAISDFLADLLSAVGLGGSVPTWVAWLVLIVLLVVLLGLLVWTVRAGAWGRRRRQGEDEAIIVATDADRAPDDWLQEAERHEAEGRWRHGLLCRYRALVTRLVEADLIPATVGRTAGEYVHDVQSRLGAGSEAATSFSAATELFEAAWYGGLETGPHERDRFVRLADTTLLTAERSVA